MIKSKPPQLLTDENAVQHVLAHIDLLQQVQDAIVPKLGLTKRQLEFYNFVRAYIWENGVSPSFSEIMEGVNIKSRSQVHMLLKMLVERGHLTYRYGCSRSIQVVPNFFLSEGYSNVS